MSEKFICTKCGKERVSIKYEGTGICGFCRRPKRVHSEETRNKIRVSTLGKDYTSRKKAISESRTQRDFTEEELQLLKNTSEKYPWVTNVEIFIEKSGIEKTYGKVKKAKKEFVLKTFISTEGRVAKFYPLSIQRWSDDTIEKFKECFKTLEYVKDSPQEFFKKTFGINSVNGLNSVTELFLGKTLYSYPRTGAKRVKATWIERWIKEFLLRNKVPFRSEVYVNRSRWRVDFLVKDKFVIEVNGTYFHGDPRVYEEEDLNEVQLDNRKRDFEKLNWLRNNGFLTLEIWEKDIEERPFFVEQELNNYIGDYYGEVKHDGEISIDEFFV